MVTNDFIVSLVKLKRGFLIEYFAWMKNRDLIQMRTIEEAINQGHQEIELGNWNTSRNWFCFHQIEKNKSIAY